MNPFGGLNDDSDAELPEILGADDDESFNSDEDDDLFVLEQLAWEPTRTQGKLVAIAVGRDTIIVGTDKRLVILLRVDRDPQLLVVGKKEDLIHALFVDEEANHLIVTMKNGLNFYINLTSSHASSRRKQTQTALSKVKGITIESMYWNKSSFRDSTGLCLCGTSNGCIYSLQISEGKERIFSKLYDFKSGSYGSGTSTMDSINHSESTCFRVCGLHVEQLNTASLEMDHAEEEKKDVAAEVDQQIAALKSLGFVDEAIIGKKKNKKKKKHKKKEDKKYYIVAVIPSKIFEFIGGPTFDDVFKFYDDKQDIFMEIPGSLKHTKLCAYKPHNQMTEAIGWLTEPGIVLCRPVFGSHVTASSGVIGQTIDENIIAYGGDSNEAAAAADHDDRWHGMGNTVPISFAVTQFHLVLVYSSCYLVINRLSKECVHFESIPCKPGEECVDIAIASNIKFIYVLSTSQIFQIRAQDEARDVWQLFLSNRDFSAANKYARSAWQKCKILRCEAEYYFSTSRFNDAALKYVQLTDIEEKENGENVNYEDVSFEEISLKFLNAGATDALMTFLVEKLNRMHNDDKTQRVILATWLTEMHLSRMNSARQTDVEDECSAVQAFESFLKSYRNTLSNCKQVIFDLIASHGRSKQLVEFARIMQDYKWVINHYITNHEYKMAIRVLATLQKPSCNEELYYEFSPILMNVSPADTVAMLIKVQSLDPKKLIPALMSECGNQSIRYLMHCIDKGHEKSKDPAIHNYLISLYCKQPSEANLLKFIKQHAAKPLFDVKYALRLCHQEDKRRSCVELYKMMKLWEEAIRLALTLPFNHYELAKTIATQYCAQHKNNKTEAKRLWLIIARHVVDKLESDEIKQVLHIINESSVLSIEDILPHLKDFTEIGPFKKDIKQSLEKYSQQIVKLQKEMQNYTNNAKQIRKDTKNLLLRSSMITSNRKCDLSGKPILNTQFILFPCTHIFRLDALKQRVAQYKQFETDELLCEYAASQCALCGDMMIDEVTTPFIDYEDQNDRKEAQQWHVGSNQIQFIYNQTMMNKTLAYTHNTGTGTTTHAAAAINDHKIQNLADINIDELAMGI
eukprot:165705_1